MANPNIVNVTAIYGASAGIVPTGTSATTWTALTPAAGTVNKVGSIVAANVTSSSATITLSLNSATGGGGTPFRLAFQMTIPGNTTLILVDKSTGLYVGEGQSIVVTSNVSSAIELVATYESLT